MRLYRILETGWAGTQADAKARSKDAVRPWHECEVPTDKPGLLAFLEARNVPGADNEVRRLEQLHEPLEPEPMDVPPPEPPASDPERVHRNWTAQEIAEFILDRAEVHQVENIMAAIGTRIAELAKRAKLAA